MLLAGGAAVTVACHRSEERDESRRSKMMIVSECFYYSEPSHHLKRDLIYYTGTRSEVLTIRIPRTRLLLDRGFEQIARALHLCSQRCHLVSVRPLGSVVSAFQENVRCRHQPRTSPDDFVKDLTGCVVPLVGLVP